MGMSANEARAFQALIDAISGAMKDTDPKHLTPEFFDHLAEEYVTMDKFVQDAAVAFVRVVIEENANLYIARASASPPAPGETYFY